MTDGDERADGLRREYEAGRIDANAYISAGGDPDVVRDHEAAQAAEKVAKEAEASRAGNKAVLGCLLIPVLLIGGCVALGSLGGDKKPTPEGERYGVTSVCEKAVRQQLKDPDSAKFDWSGVSPTTSTERLFSYEGTGVVRAQNSLGGVATHTFTCAGTYSVASGEARATATLS